MVYRPCRFDSRRFTSPNFNALKTALQRFNYNSHIQFGSSRLNTSTTIEAKSVPRINQLDSSIGQDLRHRTTHPSIELAEHVFLIKIKRLTKRGTVGTHLGHSLSYSCQWPVSEVSCQSSISIDGKSRDCALSTVRAKYVTSTEVCWNRQSHQNWAPNTMMVTVTDIAVIDSYDWRWLSSKDGGLGS